MSERKTVRERAKAVLLERWMYSAVGGPEGAVDILSDANLLATDPPEDVMEATRKALEDSIVSHNLDYNVEQAMDALKRANVLRCDAVRVEDEQGLTVEERVSAAECFQGYAQERLDELGKRVNDIDDVTEKRLNWQQAQIENLQRVTKTTDLDLHNRFVDEVCEQLDAWRGRADTANGWVDNVRAFRERLEPMLKQLRPEWSKS